MPIDDNGRITKTQEIPAGEDLSDIRPGKLALLIEGFMDNHNVPLHTRAGAVFQLAANYIWQGLKPKE